MSSEEVSVKREKKEKKHKKSKKQKEEPEAEIAQDAPASEEAVEVDEESKEKSSKKRKREAIPEELEIDVSLPEPPSKKALRKAKKSKTAGTSDTEGAPTANGADTEGETEGEAKPSKLKDNSGTKKDEEKERRTEHSIWIGNLPWTATKQDLRDFLCNQASLSQSQIVRLHMPAPDKKVARDTKGRPPFANRGFAYVDFDGPEALFSALQLTETPFNGAGRNVLIKNAKSFEGRPDEHASAAAEGKTKGGPVGNPQKPPSKRVFVGNLAFEITKEDLETHFAQCGEVEGIHMATFEDSGKCKGYAWVTFSTLEAAESAVRGWIIKEPEEDDDEEGDEENGDAEGDSNEEDASAKTKRKKKGRKWFVNRMIGRELKREYAEDASVRYKKRYGGGGAEKRRQDGLNNAEAGDDAPAITEVDRSQSQQQYTSSHDRRREQRKAGRPKVDARTIAPGAALARAQRSTGAITQSKGSKVTFD